jgi:ABC-type Fe3+ transport system substrate-binding protein
LSSHEFQGAPRRRFLTSMLAAGGAAYLPGCATLAPVDTLESLYAAARREGSITYYGGGPIAAHRQAADGFSKMFPGIQVNIASGNSNELAPRIDQQLAARKLEVDVTLLQTVQDFDRWKRAGAMALYRGPTYGGVHEAFKDADGGSIGVRVSAIVYAYNGSLLAPADVPKSALDFLHPRFRGGKIISNYPHDDDVSLFNYHTIVQKYGWKWMDGLMANQPRFIRGHVGVAEEIARGRAIASFDATVATANMPTNKGRTKVSFPVDDLVPIFTLRCGIFKDCPHPNAARLFEAWLLSKDYQASAGMWPTRADVPATGGLQPITSYRLANNFREFVEDEALVADLRKRFESYIGPIKGEPVLGPTPEPGS